jgi:hypothetical protein
VALLPKALRDFLGFCFYFWSNEGGDNREPIHVHISRGKPTANATKIWLKSDGSLEIGQPLPNDMGTAVIKNDRTFVPRSAISPKPSAQKWIGTRKHRQSPSRNSQKKSPVKRFRLTGDFALLALHRNFHFFSKPAKTK